jgi:hypothetical protein
MASRDLHENTLAQFDIIGCFFINKFYSHLYQLASQKLQSGHAKTLTDAYRDLIVAYVRGVQQPQTYLQTLKELIAYWSQLTTGFQTPISEFEDKILIEFIPPEYFREFTSRDRESVLQKIIADAVSHLASECIKGGMLAKIIDKHTDESNVTLLQRKMVDHFATVRNGYFEKFVQSITKSNQTAHSQTIDALKQECVNLARRCAESEATVAKLQKMLAMALDRVDELKGIAHDTTATPTHVATHTPARVQPRASPHFETTVATPARVTPARVTPVPPRVDVHPRADVAPRASPHMSPAVPYNAHALTTPMRKVGIRKSDLQAATVEDDIAPADIARDDIAPVDPTEDQRDNIIDAFAEDTIQTETANSNAQEQSDSADSEEEYRRMQEKLEAKFASADL